MMGVKAGAQFLADHFYEIEDPFEMAIVTYALFVTGKTTVTQKAINQLRYMNRTGEGLPPQLLFLRNCP